MNTDDLKTKANRLIRRFLIILTIGIVLFSGVYYAYRTYTLSEGTRTGVLYKISKKGKIFKTYEGQVQLAGATIMNKESSWSFSVVSPEVYQKMQLMEGKNVRLYYKEMVEAFPWQGETNYMVYNVEEVK